MIFDALKSRKEAAVQELTKLIKDKKAVPINYNHYYTDNVHKKRAERIEAQLKKHVPESASSASTTSRCSLGTHHHKPDTDTKEDLERAISKWKDSVTADMEEFSCEESLDCLEAIYKVSTELAASPLHLETYAKSSKRTGSTEGLCCQRHNPGHRASPDGRPLQHLLTHDRPQHDRCQHTKHRV